jgi:small-conductance mechanosensitive channel
MNINIIEIQTIETIAVILALLLINFISRRYINRALKKFGFGEPRRRITVRIINLLSFIVAVVFIAAFWGIDQSELLIFISSAITILAIAFFAQWSLLSNITASLILFFNHHLRIGSTVKVYDKDYPIEGEIYDISIFFVHILTTNNERVTIPSNMILQKPIVVGPDDDIE